MMRSILSEINRELAKEATGSITALGKKWKPDRPKEEKLMRVSNTLGSGQLFPQVSARGIAINTLSTLFRELDDTQANLLADALHALNIYEETMEN